MADKMTINAETMAKMFLAGAKSLEAKKEWINELNVFPVPDGDTGTNMTMTIMSAAKEVAALENPDMPTLCKAISSGSLRGARGNSGVILSQLLRGFTKGVKEYEEIDIEIMATAFQRAVETAYKAVMKPKEGTILTVAKGMSDKAVALKGKEKDMVAYIDAIIAEGDAVLAKTPDMLPVLKQAGVVDSGGQGLMQVLKGIQDVAHGKEVEYEIAPASAAGVQGASAETEEEIKFGYCTEFIINIDKPMSQKTEMEYKAFLESLGDSIVVVADDDLVKTHVHTNDPGKAISKALTFGSLSRIKIDNMREEHEERLALEAEKKAAEEAAPTEPPKEMGFVAVSTGEGLVQIFKELGVDYMIEGGQTMNPSTDDILSAVEKVNAKTVFILPNNKNIIMAANQAASICEEKNVIVIPTKTIPQGITALINFIPEQTPEANEDRMKCEILNVKTGQLTYAVRDTVIDDKKIETGDYMGIDDKSICAVSKDITTTFMEMIDSMVDDESALISIYYGEDVTEEDAQVLADKVQEAHSDIDVELQFGGQAVYYYVVSVE